MYDHGEWVWIRRSSSKHGGDDDGAIKHGGDEVVEGGGSKQDAGKHGGDRGRGSGGFRLIAPLFPNARFAASLNEELNLKTLERNKKITLSLLQVKSEFQTIQGNPVCVAFI